MSDTTLKLDIKDVLRASINFVDELGAAADPTSVTFQLKKPDGTTVTGIAVTKTAVGAYFADYLIEDQPGIWYWRFEGIGGSAAAAEEQPFIVKRSAFYSLYPGM